jgi:hypothetical protein
VVVRILTPTDTGEDFGEPLKKGSADYTVGARDIPIDPARSETFRYHIYLRLPVEQSARSDIAGLKTLSDINRKLAAAGRDVFGNPTQRSSSGYYFVAQDSTNPANPIVMFTTITSRDNTFSTPCAQYYTPGWGYGIP